MHSLSLGFVFLCGLSWLLAEVCVTASMGNWTPLWLYLAGFTIMFTILGCWPAKDKTIDLAGPITSAVIGLAIMVYGFGSFGDSFIGGATRCLGGLVMIAVGALAFLGSKDKHESAH